MFTVFLLLLLIIVTALLISNEIPKKISFSIIAVFLLYISVATSVFISIPLWIITALLAIVLFVDEFRCERLSLKVFRHLQKIMPPISQTEKIALEAGDVWLEADLFNGQPNWQDLSKLSLPELSKEEVEFLDKTVDELCDNLDDWQIYKTGELSAQTWQRLKENKFFALVIPKEYGGLGFSAQAHSAIVGKIASRSIAAAVTVMVPNSLGPAELLMHYGTDKQKKNTLPKLANGSEIPCFALTSPTAGSDAGSLSDHGVIFEKSDSGKKKLFIRLNWNKRYITLAPVATLIGVAFQLSDPDKLLGDKEHLGITLALVPASLKGVQKSKRHSPVGLGFMNGTTAGVDVEVPLEAVIGEESGIGQGWRMLMECLSIGRAISLPALASAACKVAYRSSGAYARTRKQFKMPIGEFEGVQEALARIGGLTFIAEATRKMTAASVDLGIKPSLISAITKYHLTEMARTCIDDAMDIHAGRGVQFGPSNYLGLIYLSLPMSITVEGANILTRSLMIFGQGAIRCHPYLQKEMETLQIDSKEEALLAFDKLFMQHVQRVYKNGIDAFFHSLIQGRALGVKLPSHLEYSARKITLLSKNLSFCADVSFGLLGGSLKRREQLSARLGDVLSHLYMAVAVIHYSLSLDHKTHENVHAMWALQYCLFKAKVAFKGFFRNFPYRLAATKMSLIALPCLSQIKPPSDKLSQTLAKQLLSPSTLREILTGAESVYSGKASGLFNLEKAFNEVIEISLVEKKINEAIKQGKVSKSLRGEALLAELKAEGLLTESEVSQMMRTEEMVSQALAVDEF